MCLSHSVVSDSLQSHGCIPSGSSVHGILQARILEWVAMPPPGVFPTQGSDPRLLVSCIAGGLFTSSTTWEAPRLLNSEVLLFLGFFPG